MNGRPVEFMDPGLSRALGIAAIYQQPSLFPDLTVAENIALALETGGLWRRLHWRERTSRAAELLARIGASIDPDRLVATLSMPEQQLVEIAKALGADARIVDHGRAHGVAHGAGSRSPAIRTIAMLQEHGVGIIYISHRLEEVFAVADRVTVLRDGRTSNGARMESIRARLIQMMVGREFRRCFPSERFLHGPVALKSPRFRSRLPASTTCRFPCARAKSLVSPASSARAARELAENALRVDAGGQRADRVRGQERGSHSPQDAIRAGLAYVPEDRRQHGVDPRDVRCRQYDAWRVSTPCRPGGWHRRSGGAQCAPRSSSSELRHKDAISRGEPPAVRCPAAISRKSRSPAGWRPSRAS